MRKASGAEASLERCSPGRRLWDAIADAGFVQLNLRAPFHELHRDIQCGLENAAGAFYEACKADVAPREAQLAAAALLDDAGFSVIRTSELIRLRRVDDAHGWKVSTPSRPTQAQRR